MSTEVDRKWTWWTGKLKIYEIKTYDKNLSTCPFPVHFLSTYI